MRLIHIELYCIVRDHPHFIFWVLGFMHSQYVRSTSGDLAVGD
jgi:hypothetical protein